MRSRRPPSFRKAFSRGAELLVEQVVRLVDKADENVSDHRRGSRLDIGPIGLIGPILLAAQAPHKLRFFAVLIPELLLPHPQEISVILQKLLEARPRHINELYFSLLRSS